MGTHLALEISWPYSTITASLQKKVVLEGIIHFCQYQTSLLKNCQLIG